MGDTASYTKRLVNDYELTPNKSLGQVFLISDGILDRIVEAIAPESSDFIIEIGAGLGGLTRRLAPECELIAFEIDKNLCGILNSEIEGAEILNRDFLKVDLGYFVEAWLAGEDKKIKVCGNLPFGISSQILIRMATTDTPYLHSHFMVQKELGEKVHCKPGEGDFGRISTMVQTFCTVERLFNVPAGAFYPIPNVDSTFLKLQHRDEHLVSHNDLPAYGAFVKLAFAQRRKSLFNNIRSALELETKLELDGVLADILAIGASRNTRSEEIHPDDMARLFLRLMHRVLPPEEDLA